MKRKVLIISALLVFVLLFQAGCSNKKETPPAPEDSFSKQEDNKDQDEELIEAEDLTGKAVNSLTGLYIDENAAKRRPIAVMINNAPKALPQSGIANADIIYEALAEGGITRLTAVFRDIEGVEKIGPVRSARDYFTCFALDQDAVYVHHGGSDGGYLAIKNRKLDAINGMYDDSAFWRDKTRYNTPGMMEHSSYTNGEKILAFCEAKGYRMEAKLQSGFSFYATDTEPAGDKIASTVTLDYSPSQKSSFTFIEDTGVYQRSQNGSQQIDELTGEVVEVKNLIIQFVPMRTIDDVGRLDLDLIGKGTGYYITDGKMMEITWSKKSAKDPTQWYNSTGSSLTLNQGKTWICAFPPDRSVTFQ